MVTAFSVFLSAYNYSYAELPLYRSLGPQRSTKKMLSTILMTLFFTFLIYSCTGYFGIYLFGSALQENILDSIANQNSTSGTIIQVIFCVLLLCHVPYIFIFCKEGAIEFANELNEKSVSYTIERSFQGKKTKKDRHKTREVLLTLGMYSLCVLVACQTDNLGLIFDYIGAFGISGI